MSRMVINGIEIAYELLGAPSGQAVALTPGGRFALDTPGLRELGERLVAGGMRVLLWDRPNCGASDISFEGEDESSLHADTLAVLIRSLGLGPTALAGGSAGSRVSLMTAARHPDLVSHLVLWWISGGPIGLMTLAGYYCGASAIQAVRGGMAAVADLPAWAEQIARNPRNRDILLAQDPSVFIATMQRWASFYRPADDTPVPGLPPAAIDRIKAPVMILRNGLSDLSHPRETSDWLGELMPGADMRDPPWPDDEWNQRSMARDRGEAPGLFVNWPSLDPLILEHIAKSA
ncbi:MAG: alpha/beta hydrolase [Novosphingobium sp.]